MTVNQNYVIISTSVCNLDAVTAACNSAKFFDTMYVLRMYQSPPHTQFSMITVVKIHICSLINYTPFFKIGIDFD